ncbi:MAG: hypothetical protein JWO08_4211, partial [Verrucomicrobiaceae bacterium]|nr:hypothetical protein [Verrucomicrobiaceae bacterium]
PLCPPADPEKPEWKNLSSNIGNQYWKPATAFGNLQQPNNFLYHFLASQQPGTVDTSAISTDHINNANTINGVFEVIARLGRAKINPTELQSVANTQVYKNLPQQFVPQYSTIEDPGHKYTDDGKDQLHTAHVLLDGSDSIGAFGALARVYLNIGTFYEQWGRCHNAVIGFTPQRPFSVKTCQTNSVYWMTNEQYRAPYLAAFFTMQHTPKPRDATENTKDGTGKPSEPAGANPTPGAVAAGDQKEAKGAPSLLPHNSTQAMKLRSATDANGETASSAAQSYLALDTAAKRKHGREVWIDNCAICHSSKQPEDFRVTFKHGTAGVSWALEAPPSDNTYTLPMDANNWQDFKASTAYKQYKARLRNMVGPLTDDPLDYKAEFWKDNYLSTDIRVPVTLIGTNAGRTLGTNAVAENVWDNFSSTSYKKLDKVGAISYTDPITGRERTFEAPGGGVGYYRPATHVSLWATAPFLHNNTLGLFREDPSVTGRLVQFSDSIRRVLWKDKRKEKEPQFSKAEWGWLKAEQAKPKLADSTNEPWYQITEKTVVAREGDLRGTGSEAARHDSGFVYRVPTEETFLEFAPSYAHPFVLGLFGPFATWVLIWGLWLLLVPVLAVLTWVRRPRYVGVALILLALIVGVGLFVTGVGGSGGTSKLAVILMAVSGLLDLMSWQWWIIAAVLMTLGVVFLQTSPEDRRTPRVLLGLVLLALVYLSWSSLHCLWASLVLGITALAILCRARPSLAGLSRGFFTVLTLAALAVGYTANRFILGEKLFTVPISHQTVGPLSLKVGPIPQGTPVNLVMNIDRDSPNFIRGLVSLVLAMAEIKKENKKGDEAYEILARRAGDPLLDASKCKDFTLDRGHLFGETLDTTSPEANDKAKEDLIAFLKTL